jgi:hypothetical protein
MESLDSSRIKDFWIYKERYRKRSHRKGVLYSFVPRLIRQQVLDDHISEDVDPMAVPLRSGSHMRLIVLLRRDISTSIKFKSRNET